jgi:hypothetical protein
MNKKFSFLITTEAEASPFMGKDLFYPSKINNLEVVLTQSTQNQDDMA